MLTSLLMMLLFLTSLFLIVLVLIQRGKGGGLAGAFGGMGGQSAFGTKAGDLFTRITIGVAAFWIILCIVSVKLLSEGSRNIALAKSRTRQQLRGAGDRQRGPPRAQPRRPRARLGHGRDAGQAAPDTAAPASTRPGRRGPGGRRRPSSAAAEPAIARNEPNRARLRRATQSACRGL